MPQSKITALNRHQKEEQNMRMFNGCGVRIDNFVTRVTVRHHEAYPEISHNCEHTRAA